MNKNEIKYKQRDGTGDGQPMSSTYKRKVVGASLSIPLISNNIHGPANDQPDLTHN